MAPGSGLGVLVVLFTEKIRDVSEASKGRTGRGEVRRKKGLFRGRASC